MKRILVLLITISLLYSCKEDEQKMKHYSEFSVVTENKDGGHYRINQSNGEYLNFISSGGVTGNFKKGEKDGLWQYRNSDGHNFDSIVLYKNDTRLCQLNITYENDYSQLKDGWYLYSSRTPYEGLVPFFEYGEIKNGNKEGEWMQIIDWRAFSNMAYMEKRNGNYENGKKMGKWLIEYTDFFCDEEGSNCFQYSLEYYKSYNGGKLVSFEGYLVSNDLRIDELKFYTPDSCAFKTERYKEGVKNGIEEYYDCSIADVFEDNMIMKKDYKNGKLHGKLYRLGLGKIIYEADYQNGVKLSDTTLFQ